MHVTEEQIKAALTAEQPSHGKICVHHVDTQPVGLRYADETKWGVIGRLVGHVKDGSLATIDFLMTKEQLQDTIATLVATGITIEMGGLGAVFDIADIATAEGEERAP